LGLLDMLLLYPYFCTVVYAAKICFASAELRNPITTLTYSV
jgi:hypothetical protein